MENIPRTVTLNGGGPWGFRLIGGVDFHSSLAISKVRNAWFWCKCILVAK